ncbi:MAG: HAD family hydrolase [bacterium]|nr:HAD family hydrolase [bacterium]
MNDVAIQPNAVSLASVAAIVFDKDGTLINLHARWAPWIGGVCRSLATACGDLSAVGDLEEALGVIGDRLIADSPAAVMTGSQIHQVAVDLMVSRSHDRRAVAGYVATAFRSSPVGELIPLGDVAGAMRKLRERGIKLAIATSDDRANTLEELAELGVLQYIEAIRCGDDPGPIKPDPEVLFVLAADLGVMPGRMVFVGDSLHDLATAAAAGIPFVGVLGGSSDRGELEADAQHLIADIGELLAVS